MTLDLRLSLINSSVRHDCVAAFSKKLRMRPWWLMAVSEITFYGDESGSHADPSGVYILSGYLAADEVWEEFESQWHDALHAGHRPIEYLHMRECFKLEKEFEGFNRYQADKKLNALIDVFVPFLRSKKVTEFTSVFDWGIYNRAVTGAVREVFNNPYLFLFGALQGEVSKFVADSNKPSPIYFFFDEQFAELEKQAAYQFYRSRGSIPDNIGRLLDGLTFKDDRYCYPLQAADMIAWHRHRDELGLTRDGGAKELKRLHNAAMGGFIHRFHEDGLVEFCGRMQVRLKEKGLL